MYAIAVVIRDEASKADTQLAFDDRQIHRTVEIVAVNGVDGARRVAANLIARCELRLAALRRGGRPEILRKAHELWKRDARAQWKDMTLADQGRTNKARLDLEAGLAEAEAVKAKKTAS